MKFAVDAAFVISLARRPDRLAAFCDRVPADWSLPEIDVWPAVDGQEVERPAWWRTSPGAWGCYQSHAAIVNHCLAENIDRVLVLEDDSTFAADFTARLDALEVPDDCQQLYLGGQHLSPADRGPSGLVVGRNVNRTHAFALLGCDTLEIFRQHLEPGSHWTSRQHIDHHLGSLHRHRRIRVYAVSPWLCGQAAGSSDVGRGSTTERWWSR